MMRLWGCFVVVVVIVIVVVVVLPLFLEDL